MKAIIITFNYGYDFETRAKYIENILREDGYEVDYLISDFDHRNKCKFKIDRNNVHYIKVPVYKKNVSLKRIYSCMKFAKDVRQYLSTQKFDLVYHLAPPNSTIKELSELKKEKPFTLVTEIGDMWPESLPFHGTLKKVLSPILTAWANLRNKSLDNSNLIIAECDLFKDLLKKKTKNANIFTFYFCKPFIECDQTAIPSLNEEMVLCYLGSINNIIDIELIEQLLKRIAVKKNVVFHIIGDGENRDELVTRSKNAGANVIFHGMIFEDEEKKAIFEKCHFALNIMKDSVFVGMTMKSLDYFSFGIPMINSVGGDIYTIVENDNIGFNVSHTLLPNVVRELVEIQDKDYLAMRQNVKQVHNKYFGVKSFEEKFKVALKRGK